MRSEAIPIVFLKAAGQILLMPARSHDPLRLRGRQPTDPKGDGHPCRSISFSRARLPALLIVLGIIVFSRG